MSTAGLAAGNYELFARALDSRGVWSAPVSAELTVIQAPSPVPPSPVPPSPVPQTPPILAPISNQTITAGGALVISLSAQNSSGATYGAQALIYSAAAHGMIVAPASTIGVSISGNEAIFRPAATFSGTFQVSATARNSVGTATQTFTVAVVAAVETPPVLAPISNETIAAGTSLSIPLVVQDPDCLGLTYGAQDQVINATGQPAGNPIGVSISGNTLTLRPAATFSGLFEVTATAQDGFGIATQTFLVAVTSPTGGNTASRSSGQSVPGASPAATANVSPAQAAQAAELVDSAIGSLASSASSTASRPLSAAALAALYGVTDPRN
jgi:hypothetical protein